MKTSQTGTWMGRRWSLWRPTHAGMDRSRNRDRSRWAWACICQGRPGRRKWEGPGEEQKPCHASHGRWWRGTEPTPSHPPLTQCTRLLIFSWNMGVILCSSLSEDFTLQNPNKILSHCHFIVYLRQVCTLLPAPSTRTESEAEVELKPSTLAHWDSSTKEKQFLGSGSWAKEVLANQVKRSKHSVLEILMFSTDHAFLVISYYVTPTPCSSPTTSTAMIESPRELPFLAWVFNAPLTLPDLVRHGPQHLLRRASKGQAITRLCLSLQQESRQQGAVERWEVTSCVQRTSHPLCQTTNAACLLPNWYRNSKPHIKAIFSEIFRHGIEGVIALFALMSSN